MSRATRALGLEPGGGLYFLSQALATIVSATNPDGTQFRLPVEAATPTSADILAGRLGFVASGAAATLITIPAGRAWKGTIGASVSVANAGGVITGGQASASFTTAGAGVSPSAAIYLGVDANVGADLAAGVTGKSASNFGFLQITVIAPAGNAVTIQVTPTCSGTSPIVDAFAFGELL